MGNTMMVIVICSLVGVIALLITMLYFQKTLIKETFEANDALKRSLFNLINEEQSRHERILNNRASFDEKCLYDLVRRVEGIEKKLGNVNPDSKKTIDVMYSGPRKGGN